jgi:hypothetical protein
VIFDIVKTGRRVQPGRRQRHLTPRRTITHHATRFDSGYSGLFRTETGYKEKKLNFRAGSRYEKRIAKSALEKLETACGTLLRPAPG